MLSTVLPPTVVAARLLPHGQALLYCCTAPHSRERGVIGGHVHAGAVEQLVLGGLVGACLVAEQHGSSPLRNAVATV
jgi:hypothetical protein